MSKVWNKELVQQHAQVAVAVELYTLPFYITALASIKEASAEAFGVIMSVVNEEMLHLELAANLCLALDTTPNFRAPTYGVKIPYLDPTDPETGHSGLIKGTLGPLNEETLNTMLDIETPEELEVLRLIDHSTPQYPYATIGALYGALLAGIDQVGPTTFSWTTTNQQMYFTGPHGKNPDPFPQKIGTYDQAKGAVNAIIEQGEGKPMSPVPSTPYTEADFPVPAAYQMTGDTADPKKYAEYSHYGRFVKIKNDGLPAVYTGTSQPEASQNRTLQGHFAQLISDMNTLWTTGTGDIWVMTKLLQDAQECWKHGVIPQWTAS